MSGRRCPSCKLTAEQAALTQVPCGDPWHQANTYDEPLTLFGEGLSRNTDPPQSFAAGRTVNPGHQKIVWEGHYRRRSQTVGTTDRELASFVGLTEEQARKRCGDLMPPKEDQELGLGYIDWARDEGGQIITRNGLGARRITGKGIAAWEARQ